MACRQSLSNVHHYILDYRVAGESTAVQLCGKQCSVRSCKCFTKIIFSDECYMDTYVSVEHAYFTNHTLFSLIRSTAYKLMTCRLIRRSEECSAFTSLSACSSSSSSFCFTRSIKWWRGCVEARGPALPISDK